MFDSETSHFSFFDFLGYLIPGAIGLISVKWIMLLWDISFWGLRDWIALLEVNLRSDGGAILFSMWGVVLSYLFGHLLAFLSSVTVEVFSHKLYKYPSDFLLKRLERKKEETKEIEQEAEEFRAPKKLTCFLYIIIYLILAPVFIPSFLIGKCLRFDYFYLKPLDEIYVWNINDRFLALLRKLRIDTGKGEDAIMERFGEKKLRRVYDSDFHRIAYHYEYEKTERHQNKLDSYIALYGFMRAMCFLAVALFWVFVAIIAKQSLWCVESVCFLVVLFVLPYIFFMAFMKFYRRHTLETFMCLMVDEELATVDTAKRPESNNPSAPKPRAKTPQKPK